MSIKELFDYAIEIENVDLQALIMFLTLEKKVLSMNDDVNKLDLYFLEKHNERMNKELHAYKQKMNIKNKPHYFEVVGDGKTIYVQAINEREAILNSKIREVKSVTLLSGDYLMEYNGKITKLKNVPKLGGVDFEIIRS